MTKAKAKDSPAFKTRKRLYAGLVTVSPPKESAGTIQQAATQEVSSLSPTLVVPQEESETAERISTLRLFDAALTPHDLPGTYGIPPWALDTARLARACYHAKRAGMLPAIDSPDGASYYACIAVANHMGPVQRMALANRAAMLHGMPCRDYDSAVVESWDDALAIARGLVETQQARGETTMPEGGGGQGGGKPEPMDSEESNGDGDNGEGDSLDDLMSKILGNPRGKVPKQFRQPEDIKPKPKPKAPQYLPCEKHPKGEKIPEHELEDSNPWHAGKTPPPQSGRHRTGTCLNYDKPDVLKMLPRKRKRGARKRSAYEGGTIARLNRLCSDGKIFKAGIARRGGYRGRGTVMVDMSASMSWTESDIKTLLEVLPECSVYGYCGLGGKGRLVLLADRGKTVDLAALTAWKRYQGSGNEIDDSALRFLCRQAKPRVWVSDGGACASGCDTQYMVNRCNEAIAAGSIVRVQTGIEAAAYILGLSVKR